MSEQQTAVEQILSKLTSLEESIKTHQTLIEQISRKSFESNKIQQRNLHSLAEKLSRKLPISRADVGRKYFKSQMISKRQDRSQVVMVSGPSERLKALTSEKNSSVMSKNSPILLSRTDSSGDSSLVISSPPHSNNVPAYSNSLPTSSSHSDNILRSSAPTDLHGNSPKLASHMISSAPTEPSLFNSSTNHPPPLLDHTPILSLPTDRPMNSLVTSHPTALPKLDALYSISPIPSPPTNKNSHVHPTKMNALHPKLLQPADRPENSVSSSSIISHSKTNIVHKNISPIMSSSSNRRKKSLIYSCPSSHLVSSQAAVSPSSHSIPLPNSSQPLIVRSKNPLITSAPPSLIPSTRPVPSTHFKNTFVSSPPAVRPVKHLVLCNALPSSEIDKSKLMSLDEFMSIHSSVIKRCKYGIYFWCRLLARQVFFGSDVLKRCTAYGHHKWPGLPIQELNECKQAVMNCCPALWNDPNEFEKQWNKYGPLTRVCGRERQDSYKDGGSLVK